MKLRDAETALEDAEVIPLFEAPIAEAKRIQQRCLDADVPTLLGKGGGDCRTGCAPRAQVLVREADAPKVANLLHEEWMELALREGTVQRVETRAVHPDEGGGEAEGDPPCPCCGSTKPLEEGACPECGLQLG